MSVAPVKHPISDNSGVLTRPWWLYFNNLDNENTLQTVSINSDTTLTSNIKYVVCDTDSGAITVTLEAGTNGTEHIIINAGTSGNDVTLVPNGTEKLFQVAGGTETIYDGEQFAIVYQTTEGWN